MSANSFLLIFLSWSLLSIAAAYYAENRQIGFWATLFISLITSPVVGFIIGAMSPLKARVIHSSSYVANVASSADEILKYKKLLDTGVITREEFEAFKKKLLSQ